MKLPPRQEARHSRWVSFPLDVNSKHSTLKIQNSKSRSPRERDAFALRKDSVDEEDTQNEKAGWGCPSH
jgi:hypothetical protein